MTDALNTLAGLLIFKIAAALATTLGILWLTLAVVGVYGVMSYAASQRTHEIGIRMALGASSQQILLIVLRQGIVIVGLGLIIGVAGARLAVREVGNFVAVSPTDPLTYLTVSAALTVVALFASYMPVCRAVNVDPMIALRYE